MDADAAGVLVATGGLEGDGSGTTALVVGDDATARATGVSGLASRTVRHAVMALDVGVTVRGDLHLIDGHGVAAVARDGWAVLDVGLDAFALETVALE